MGHEARPPASSESLVLVAAAVVRRDGRFLVGRRPPGKRHGNRWEFPGGKVRHGESLAAAVTRELREELGLQVTGLDRVLFEARDPGSRFLIRFVEARVFGVPRAREHSEVAWCDEKALNELELAPADRRFVESVVGAGGHVPEP